MYRLLLKCMTLNDTDLGPKRYLSFFVADLREITLAISISLSTATRSIEVSNETNNCLHGPTPYRSKLTAASRGFPAIARLSC